MVKRDRIAVENCPVFVTSQILGKRWTILILQALMMPKAGQGIRFSEIQKNLEWISPKVLTQRLRELEKENVLTRKVDASSIPPKVSYQLTAKGEELRDVLTMMQQWGMKYGSSDPGICNGVNFENCDGCTTRVPS
ncbi:MAG: winged helix-turn-helix transcriptional regulator [Candidatus Thorarchaeota archaeon]|jgi:DNA-binding HxlR family transcriptional regulator